MDEVADAYAGVAGRYIELFGRMSSVHSDDVDLIERHLARVPAPVLDAGCGPGHLTEHLLSLGVEAIGLDITSEFVDHARRSTALDRFAVGSLRDLPLRSRPVGGVLAWYSLIHFRPPHIGPVVAELRRVIVTGGIIVVGVFDGIEVAEFPHRVTTAVTWPIDTFAMLLADVGFHEIERLRRPANPTNGTRAHAAIVAIAQ